jgi:glycosyltransferase involved in cell wall biosynthesis
MQIVMTAAHGGYDSDQVPLGGGAAVCERLCRVWGAAGLDVTLIGSGPVAPAGVRYVRCGGLERLPSSLSEFEYGAFSRRFEREATEWLLGCGSRPVVLSHDISEGPSFGRLARAGIDCLSILHVDVVDYFQRFYLGDVVPAHWWARLHEHTNWLPWPDLLRLVFDKQLQAARHCRHLIVPSPRMETILRQCYPDMPRERVQVVGWGSPLTPVEAAPSALEEWGLGADTPLVLTMSRISPEKSQDILLRALQHGEARGEVPAGLVVAVVGGPSYMQGQRFLQRLEGLAAGLKSCRVLFPGHMGGGAKRAALERADVFVMCSRHESYGLTIMEALAAGTPVAAIRSYGVDVTVDSSCGVVVEGGAGAERRLWEAIRSLLADRERLRELSAGALARAQRDTFDHAAARLLQLCQGWRTPG